MTEPPKLIVDNKADDDLVAYGQKLIDLNEKYPEIQLMMRRAYRYKDMAMRMALFDLMACYGIWQDIVAEDNRNELHVVDKEDT